jgi:hypothetical protein
LGAQRGDLWPPRGPGGPLYSVTLGFWEVNGLPWPCVREAEPDAETCRQQ